MIRVSRRAALSRLGALAALAAPARVAAEATTTLRVGSIPDDGLTPVLFARQSGIFRRLGLDVQLQSQASGAAFAAAMVGGTLDVAKSSLMTMIEAYAHGIRFKIIAGGPTSVTAKAMTELVVLKDSSITSLAEVDGKTIASTALRSFDQLGTRALIDRSGGSSATVRFVEMPYAMMLPALEQGRADVVAITNPFLAAALQTGKVRTLGDPYEGIGGRFLIAGWFCTEAFAARNPGLVRRFAEGVRRGAAYTNAHPAETVPLLAAYTRFDAAKLANMPRMSTATTAVDAGEIQPVIDAAAKYGFIDAPFPAQNLLP